MRTFLAIELPGSVRDQVQQIQQQLQSYLRSAQADGCIRWTRVEKIHLTLRFLGETNAEQQQLITQRLNELVPQYSPFSLSLTDLGCFPHWREPSVVWLAVRGDLQALQQLQVQTEQIAQQAGFPAESRAFAPHITIGRAGRNVERVRLRHTGAALRNFQPESTVATGIELVKIAPFIVDQITYMQSELRAEGAHYTPLAHSTLTNQK